MLLRNIQTVSDSACLGKEINYKDDEISTSGMLRTNSGVLQKPNHITKTSSDKIFNELLRTTLESPIGIML